MILHKLVLSKEYKEVMRKHLQIQLEGLYKIDIESGSLRAIKASAGISVIKSILGKLNKNPRSRIVKLTMDEINVAQAHLSAQYSAVGELLGNNLTDTFGNSKNDYQILGPLLVMLEGIQDKN